jgi:tetratricopeptide (TPR) repeat protein
MIKRRYAAYSLPRHVAIGSLVVDSQGHFVMGTTEICTDLRKNLFDSLLCDKCFINARAKLLGIGNNLPAVPDKTLNNDGMGAQIMKIAEQTHSKDCNLLFSTSCQTKDIEWCASLCIPDHNEPREQNKSDNISALSLAACLDAIARWAELLMAYHLLHYDGKFMVCTDNKDSQLMSYCKDTRDDKPFSAAEIAESLLAKEDPWTMKNNLCFFINDLSKEIPSIKTSPKGRRRKIISNPQQEANHAPRLAHVLKVDINELRTSISLGRSLFGLAQFLELIFEKDLFDKKLNESSSEISRLHGIQCFCLMNAIDVLSCSATILGYILSLDKQDEDDLDEAVDPKFGPNDLCKEFASKREESSPLLSVAGILSADAWFSFGKLVGKACKVGASDQLMLLCFERVLLILNSPKTYAFNSRAVEFSSQLSPLTQYKCFLQSNATHSIGVFFYEQGDFDHAGEHFDKASRLRRQMLDDPSQMCDADHVILSELKSNFLFSSAHVSEEECRLRFKHSLAYACSLLPRGFDVNELELNLSLTLEYCALNQHALQKYQHALSLLQESLILRSIHVGKESLDVASLHFNKGVVYDDLEYYDAAISRYQESLRIRLDQRNKAASPKVVAELDDSVLLT